MINSRDFTIKSQNKSIVWFDFEELCEKPRSQHDYIYIAQHFHTLIISHVPQLDNGSCSSELYSDRTRRFISLIDEMYDRSIHLIASFETALDQIYRGHKLAFLFNRTYSRLFEMQTQEYTTRVAQIQMEVKDNVL